MGCVYATAEFQWYDKDSSINLIAHYTEGKVNDFSITERYAGSPWLTNIQQLFDMIIALNGHSTSVGYGPCNCDLGPRQPIHIYNGLPSPPQSCDHHLQVNREADRIRSQAAFSLSFSLAQSQQGNNKGCKEKWSWDSFAFLHNAPPLCPVLDRRKRSNFVAHAKE